MKPKTIGSITRAISRCLKRSDALAKKGIQTSANWETVTRRHFEIYAKRKGLPCEIRGPQGICARIWVKVGRRERNLEPDNNGYIWRFVSRDYTQPLLKFAPDTVGAINGMDYETIELKQNMTLDAFFDFKT